MKKVAILMLAFVMVFTLVSCSSGNDPGVTDEGDAPYRVAVIVWSMAEEFGVYVVEGARRAADRLGISMTNHDPAGDMQKMIAIIEDLIQQEVDAVIIAPVEGTGASPYVDAMREAGIIVVNYDLEVDTFADGYVLSDNYQGGRDSGELFLERYLEDEGLVFVTQDYPSVLATIDRSNGFSDYVKENRPGMTFVDQLTVGTRDTYRTTIENTLTAYPETIGIFCYTGDIAIVAHNVVKTIGREDIIICGYDATPEQIEIMKQDGLDSNLISSVALYPINIGRLCVETAFGLLEGDIEPGIRIESVCGMLTPANVNEFEDLEYAQ